MNPHQGHGGARAGAGRKRQLTFCERMRIGVACENRWQELTREASLQRAEREAQKHAEKEEPGRDTRGLLRAKQAALQAIPVPLRQARAADPTPLGGNDNIDVLVEDVRDWIRIRGGPVVADPATGASGGLVRLRGYKEQVVAEVATAASEGFGRAISSRMVKRCWDEYRRRFVNR
jgi:hypothetical protein